LTSQELQEEFRLRSLLLYTLYKRKVFGFDEIRKIVTEYYRNPKSVLGAYGVS